MSAPKDKNTFGRRRVLFQQILNYLIEHPDAKDTVEGILKWWLPGRKIEWGNEQVQEALDFLVAEGWLVKRILPSSQELFSLNRKGKKEIEVFLKALESEAALKDF